MSEKAEPEVSIIKADMVAALVDLKLALLSELKKDFKEVNKKLDRLQETVRNHGKHLTSLEDNTESLHQQLKEVERSCEGLRFDNGKLKAN